MKVLVYFSFHYWNSLNVDLFTELKKKFSTVDIYISNEGENWKEIINNDKYIKNIVDKSVDNIYEKIDTNKSYDFLFLLSNIFDGVGNKRNIHSIWKMEERLEKVSWNKSILWIHDTIGDNAFKLGPMSNSENRKAVEGIDYFFTGSIRAVEDFKRFGFNNTYNIRPSYKKEESIFKNKAIHSNEKTIISIVSKSNYVKNPYKLIMLFMKSHLDEWNLRIRGLIEKPKLNTIPYSVYFCIRYKNKNIFWIIRNIFYPFIYCYFNWNKIIKRCDIKCGYITRDDMLNEFNNASICFICSEHESLSVAIMDALISKIPTVSPIVAAKSEGFGDYVHSYSSIKELKQSLNMLNDPHFISKLREKALKFNLIKYNQEAKEKFNQVMTEIIEEYNEVFK